MALTIESVFQKCAALQAQLHPLHGVFVPLRFTYHEEYTDPTDPGPGSDVKTDIVQKTNLRYTPMHSVKMGNQVYMVPPTIAGTFNSTADVQALGNGGSAPVQGIHLSVSGGVPFNPAFASAVLQCTVGIPMDFHRDLNPTSLPITIDDKTNPTRDSTLVTHIVLDFEEPIMLRTDLIRKSIFLNK